MKVLVSARKALSVLVENPLAVVASACVDAVALVAFGFLSQPVYDKLVEHIIIISTLVSEQLRMARGQSILSALSSPEVAGFARQLAWLLALLLLVAAVIVVVSQGVNWAIARSSLMQKVRIIEELMRVARMAVVWSVIVALVYVIGLLADLRLVVISKVAPAQAGTGLVDVVQGVEIVLLFVALVHLAAGSILAGTAWIFQHKAQFLGAGVLVTSVFALVSLLLQAAAGLSQPLMVPAGLLVFLPAVMWTRVFYVGLVSNGVHS
ncbi:hypothetical protein HY490_01100 [Candidatus Woesearchaeota archaeon]|nr:hypothetical protein [Candidatus Woesearchaeota archaeon]